MSKYDDIISIPYKKSDRHQRMSMHDRSAQFAPFSALTGFDDQIKEINRIVDKFRPLSDDEKAELDLCLSTLNRFIDTTPNVVITHFVPDPLKDGGAIVTESGALKKIDAVNRVLIFTDGRTFHVDLIIKINPEENLI